MPLGHEHILHDKVFKCLSWKGFLRSFNPSLYFIKGEWRLSCGYRQNMVSWQPGLVQSLPPPHPLYPSILLRGFYEFTQCWWPLTVVLENFVAEAGPFLKDPVIWMSIATVCKMVPCCVVPLRNELEFLRIDWVDQRLLETGVGLLVG